jgi:hypothetical protein
VEDNLDDSDSEDYIPFLGELIGATTPRGAPGEKAKDMCGSGSGDDDDQMPSPTAAASLDDKPGLRARQLQLRQLHQFHQHQHVDRQIEQQQQQLGGGGGDSPSKLFDSPRMATSPHKGVLSPLHSGHGASLLHGAADDAGQKLLLR